MRNKAIAFVAVVALSAVLLLAGSLSIALAHGSGLVSARGVGGGSIELGEQTVTLVPVSVRFIPKLDNISLVPGECQIYSVRITNVDGNESVTVLFACTVFDGASVRVTVEPSGNRCVEPLSSVCYRVTVTALPGATGSVHLVYWLSWI